MELTAVKIKMKIMKMNVVKKLMIVNALNAAKDFVDLAKMCVIFLGNSSMGFYNWHSHK